MLKFLKKAVPVVFILSLALSCFPLPSAAAGMTDRYYRSLLSSMENSSAYLTVYDEFETAISNHSASVDFSVSVPMDPFSSYIYTALENDHPEWFYFERNSTLIYYSSGEGNPVSKAEPKYNYLAAPEYIAAFNAAANQILASAGITGDMSDYEKSLRLHDELAARVTYDFTYASDSYNAYGAIVLGKAVCQGYAKAYQYLLQLAGIKASVISGQSYNVSTGTMERHMWNLVYLDGDYYLTDVTWDDQSGELYHGYFNITSDLMNEDHYPDATFSMAECTAVKDNYFVRNGGMYDILDSSPYIAENSGALSFVENAIQKSGTAVVFASSGNKNGVILWFSQNIMKIIEDLDYTGSIRYSYTNLGREFHLTVAVAQEGTSEVTTPTTVTEVTTVKPVVTTETTAPTTAPEATTAKPAVTTETTAPTTVPEATTVKPAVTTETTTSTTVPVVTTETTASTTIPEVTTEKATTTEATEESIGPYCTVPTRASVLEISTEPESETSENSESSSEFTAVTVITNGYSGSEEVTDAVTEQSTGTGEKVTVQKLFGCSSFVSGSLILLPSVALCIAFVARKKHDV